jgi:hypothetical protein
MSALRYTPYGCICAGACLVLTRKITYKGVEYPVGTEVTVLWTPPSDYQHVFVLLDGPDQKLQTRDPCKVPKGYVRLTTDPQTFMEKIRRRFG